MMLLQITLQRALSPSSFTCSRQMTSRTVTSSLASRLQTIGNVIFLLPLLLIVFTPLVVCGVENLLAKSDETFRIHDVTSGLVITQGTHVITGDVSVHVSATPNARLQITWAKLIRNDITNNDVGNNDVRQQHDLGREGGGGDNRDVRIIEREKGLDNRSEMNSAIFGNSDTHDTTTNTTGEHIASGAYANVDHGIANFSNSSFSSSYNDSSYVIYNDSSSYINTNSSSSIVRAGSSCDGIELVGQYYGVAIVGDSWCSVDENVWKEPSIDHVTSSLRCRCLPTDEQPRLTMTVRAHEGAVVYRRLITVSIQDSISNVDAADEYQRYPSGKVETMDYFQILNGDEAAAKRVRYVYVGTTTQFNFQTSTQHSDTLRIVRFGFISRQTTPNRNDSFEHEILLDDSTRMRGGYVHLSVSNVTYAYKRSESERSWIDTLIVSITRANAKLHDGTYWATMIGSHDYSQTIEFNRDLVVMTTKPSSRASDSESAQNADSGDSLKHSASKLRRMQLLVLSCSDVTYEVVCAARTMTSSNTMTGDSAGDGKTENNSRRGEVGNTEKRNETESENAKYGAISENYYMKTMNERDGTLTSHFITAALKKTLPVLENRQANFNSNFSSSSHSNTVNITFRSGLPNCVYCRAEGWPLPRVQLYRADGSLLGTEESHSVYWFSDSPWSSVVAFLVRNPSEEYNGVYVCSATNRVINSESRDTAGDEMNARVDGREIVRFKITVVDV